MSAKDTPAGAAKPTTGRPDMTIKTMKAFARWHWRERLGMALIQLGASIMVPPDRRVKNREALEHKAQLRPYGRGRQ